jgi:hypothetical protein
MAVAVLVVPVFLYRIVARRVRGRGQGTPEKAMAIVIGEFDALFSPGSIHWQQEKQRMAMMRENPDSGDPPFGPIDLVSGKVVIRRPVEESGADGEPGSP